MESILMIVYSLFSKEYIKYLFRGKTTSNKYKKTKTNKRTPIRSFFLFLLISHAFAVYVRRTFNQPKPKPIIRWLKPRSPSLSDPSKANFRLYSS